jgi:hypothetical protein
MQGACVNPVFRQNRLEPGNRGTPHNSGKAKCRWVYPVKMWVGNKAGWKLLIVKADRVCGALNCTNNVKVIENAGYLWYLDDEEAA